MAASQSRTSGLKGRLRLVAPIVLVGLIVAGFLGWWFLFRDNAPAEVSSVEAGEARQAAIDEATQNQPTPVPETEPVVDPEEAAEEDATAPLDTGQPDAPASLGNPMEGLWNIDNTIGEFNPECLTDVCSSTFVGFRIKEELASIGAKTVVGRTPGITGSMEIAGNQVVAASFVADMTQLITDSAGRTEALQGRSGGLETSTFPEAIFVLTEPIDLGEIPPEGVAIEVEAVGDLTVHGVTRNVSIPLTAEHQAGVIVVFGSLEGMLLSDYDIPTPTAVVVVSVEDNATMELQLFFTR